MNKIKNNNQLKAFLREYAKGNTLIADNGIIEEIEQSNQHFTLTVTHKVLSSDIVQFVTFKQHENYTQGDEYNELSDVFDYENVFSVTMADGEIVEVEKTNEKVETIMTKLSIEQWAIILENVSLLDENEEFGNEIEILQLDSTNEFVLAHSYEVFEDGFKTEKEAMERLEAIENKVASL